MNPEASIEELPVDSREIKKAKLTSSNYLEVEFSQVEELTDEAIRREISQKCFWDVHPDLKTLFDKLVPHLALLCELLDSWQMNKVDGELQHDSLTKYSVAGFVIGGSDEHEGVTLIGRKTLAGNRVLNLVTPFTKWWDEHNGYMYALELETLITECKGEVLKYLDGKRAPSEQQELPFKD